MRVPGEFDAVEELLVAFPSPFEDEALLEIVSAASRTQRTTVLVSDTETQREVTRALTARSTVMGNVSFEVVGLDTVWVRDYGPIVAYGEGGTRHVVDFQYYMGTRPSDDAVPGNLARARNASVHDPGIYAEGGNFLSDGVGRCITSDKVLNVNGIGQDRLDQLFSDYLGCTTTIVLPPLIGDATGHVDMFVHVHAPGRVLVAQIDGPDTTNAARMNEAARRLEAGGFQVTRIPMGSSFRSGEFTLYRTYTNAVPIAGAVLVPIYAADARGREPALAAYRAAYPDRTIIPIESDGLIQRAGALHCVTMGISSPPAGVDPSNPPEELPGLEQDPTDPGSDDGGGCAVGGSRPAGSWMLLVLVALLAARVRGRRRRPTACPAERDVRP